MTLWNKAQEWEQSWWGNCINTFYEEEKQLVYADKMGLERCGNDKTPYVYDLHGISVLDIGGGVCSILLKCINIKRGVVIDPLSMPEWVIDRYTHKNIVFDNIKGEDIEKEPNGNTFDEVWVYNVLQHTENPKKVVENAKAIGKTIRIFEWIDTPINEGHIHTLRENDLNDWLGGFGKVEMMNYRPARGKAYYGVFPTKL